MIFQGARGVCSRRSSSDRRYRKDAVGEPILAHELPDVLLAVEFRRARGQRFLAAWRLEPRPRHADGFRRPRDRLTRCRYPRPSWVVLRPRDGADRSFAGVEEIKHRTPSMPISCLPISAQPKRAPLPTTAAVARCWPRPPSNALGPRIPKAKFWTSGSRRGLDRDQRQVPTRCANLFEFLFPIQTPALALVAGAFFSAHIAAYLPGCYGALGWRAATLWVLLIRDTLAALQQLVSFDRGHDLLTIPLMQILAVY